MLLVLASPSDAGGRLESSIMPRVLIVEDEPTIRNLLCEMLGSGYECRAIKSAEAAITGFKLITIEQSNHRS